MKSKKKKQKKQLHSLTNRLQIQLLTFLLQVKNSHDFISTSIINILVKLVVSKDCACNTQWEATEQSLICRLLFSVTRSKVMQGASLLELFHINKHILSYLLSAERSAVHHITELSSNGGV